MEGSMNRGSPFRSSAQRSHRASRLSLRRSIQRARGIKWSNSRTAPLTDNGEQVVEGVLSPSRALFLSLACSLSLSLSLSLGPVKRCARKNSYGIMGVTRTVVAIPVAARVAIVINPDVRTALQCHVKSSSIARKKGPELLPRSNEIRASARRVLDRIASISEGL